MKLPEIALKNHLFVLTTIALLIFIGIRTFNSMPRSEDPFLSVPKYTAVIVYPGASPEDMEKLIVDPIEEVVKEVDDITEIRTEIANGLAILVIESEYGIDYDNIYNDIVDAINKIRGDLPNGIAELDISQYKAEDRIVVHQFALVSEIVPYKLLNDFAEDLEQNLEVSKYIKKIEIEASPQEEIRISLDFQKMANLGIPLRQVIATLQSNNVNIPGGSIKSGNLSFNLKTTGSYGSLEDLRNTAITSDNGQIVYLRNIADINYDYEDMRWIGRFNGKKAIYIVVTQIKGGNIIKLSEELETISSLFKEQLPSTIQLETAFEQAPAVKLRINDFISNLFQGIILVGIIILIFLGWRPALIIITVIPLSILIAITFLDFSDYALQQISIAALVVALGLLVDNGIVVIENIVRFKRDGFSLMEAAAKGTSEVGYAIISSTLTTVLAFAPLSLLNSGPGEFLRSLPITVIYVLVVSLILALTFTPIMASRLLEKRKEKKTSIVLKKLDGFIEKRYVPLLRFSLRKGWIILVVGVVILLGSLTLFPRIGISFFPTADKPMLLIDVDHPYSSNIDHTDNTLKFVESVLDTTDYIANYTVNAGHGNPQVYYNRVPENYKSYHGEVLVNFEEWEPERFYIALEQLRKVFSGYPDARISFRELKNGAPFKAPIEILLIGEELDTLKRISSDVEKMLRSADGILDVDNPLAIAKTDIKIIINRDKASLYNVSLLELDQTIRASLNGLQIDNLKMDADGEDYPLVLRLPFMDRPSLDDFDKVYVANQNGEQIPINQLTSLAFEQDYAKINHFNTERTAAITANVLDPDKTKAYTEAIIPKLDAYKWPKDYRYYLGGEYETQSKSFGDLGILLITSLILIFAVLVLQFKSITQPLIIFSAIPLGISGSFIALFLSGWSFSFFAFVGFISLIGIVINNSIILVDYTNQLIIEGNEKVLAIEIAAKRRFTPIVLTSLTTILGLMPLTFSGTSLWSPLGWTLIGGMISSTLLTLLIVPILYKWLTEITKNK
ncbi:efflux RND transporter permease subunit [Flaviramulus aquimarinus]|uniref:Efflux RND transporter permease subunit n=1 Tax=Flaviramulus aquimarinus TaxID=1170456 RepID=A0ABP9ETC7_9FLAO